MAYVRFQSTEPDDEGRHPGFFGLINNLSRSGRPTPEQEELRRTNHAWYEAHYTNPAPVDPAVYDHAGNPGATAWFKESAEALVARAAGYLEILGAHGIRCDRLVAPEPPWRVIYEAEDQIVVVPHPIFPPRTSGAVFVAVARAGVEPSTCRGAGGRAGRRSGRAGGAGREPN